MSGRGTAPGLRSGYEIVKSLRAKLAAARLAAKAADASDDEDQSFDLWASHDALVDEILELLAALEDGEHFYTIAAVLAGFEGRT